MENTNVPPTHTTSKPNAIALTLVDFKKELTGDYHKTVENYFMGDKEAALKFMSAVVYSVQKVPKLLECTRETLYSAFMTCAEYRLYPSAASGEAYVLPYKDKAQFQLGYKGLITLGYRAGIKSLTTGIVRKNDPFEYEEGAEPRLVHKPDPFKTEAQRGEAIGAYAVAELEGGGRVFKVLGREAILKFKNLSQARNSEYSPWNSAQDPELHMWRKTAIKQLYKTLPQNDEMRRAIAKDDEEDSTIRRPNLDAGGPAVGKALHAPEAPAKTAQDTPKQPVASTPKKGKV